MTGQGDGGGRTVTERQGRGCHIPPGPISLVLGTWSGSAASPKPVTIQELGSHDDSKVTLSVSQLGRAVA